MRHLCLELTRACNHACRHCYNFWRRGADTPADDGRAPLSREEIRQLLRRASQETRLQYVGLTGGEPTLRPDFAEIVGDVVDSGLTPIVVTNGSRLTASLLRRLPSGINYEVTLFSHRAELYNRLAGRASFAEVLRNIARLRRHGSFLTVAFVATRLNALDVFEAVELGVALGASGVMYNRVNLGSGSRRLARCLVPDAATLRDSLFLLEAVVRKHGVQAACTIPIPPCVVDPRSFPSLHFGWCPRGGAQSYYTVGSTGLLRPCNHSSRVVGDLRSHGFSELLAKGRAMPLWKSLPEVCRTCAHPLAGKCRGGCPSAADEYYGTSLERDPFCDLAGTLRESERKGGSPERTSSHSSAGAPGGLTSGR